MQPLLFVVVGMFLAFVAEWSLRFWRRSEQNDRLRFASLVLRRNGMEAYSYLAAFGAEDAELRAALETFEHTGKVVIDKDGSMVGRLLPKVAAERGLRLVVDNTK